MKKHILLLSLLFLFQYSPLCISADSSNETDEEALLSFRNLVDTSSTPLLAKNWTNSTCFCSWFGVTCSSKRQRVVSLALPNLQLEGKISPSLANLSFLRELNLGNNFFHGAIPYNLGGLPRLRVIDIQNNQLQGSIPPGLFQHKSVKEISLGFNKLSGEIWNGSWHVPELRVLDLTNNSLTGLIPLCIGNATKLKTLSLRGNGISGNNPNEIGNLSQLSILSLANNQLTGPIPATLFNISSLLSVNLQYNRLSGLFVDEGNILSKLETLSLFYNQISSCIPSNICRLTGLKVLALAFNRITGELPRNIGCLRRLEEFYVIDNRISGTIPTSLGNISSLQYLNCKKNHMEGPVPPELSKLSNLREIIFEENHNLIGQIPPGIFNISSLEIIDFRANKLSGKIPATTGRHLPNLREVFLSENQLQGKIPPYITNASKLDTLGLYLSNNNLSGMIPSRIGDLGNMQYLYVSNNSFSGSIPLSFSDLISLEFLDLSLNSMSGTIPKSMEKLRYLQGVNFSFNDFQGEIPSGGWFANATPQSFLGNRGLCGRHVFKLPACAITNPEKQSKSNKAVVKIVAPVVTSSFLIFLMISIWIMKRRNIAKSKDVEKLPEIRTHELVSYREIQRATNNFDRSNLIGLGSSGSVFRGTLSSGTVVAIKVLDLQNEQVCKRFDTECEVMRSVRHRNLVRVITTCSSEHIRAFVLQYMPNGSLENWLYKEDFHLNLLQRVTIMLDVAMGIEYLHYGYDTPIVHCDLKPANILLNENMVAHVGDFGISKFLAVSKVTTHTETLGTLGYIAPEYGLEGMVSTSGDVYSYGIMMMEVLARKRPTDEELCNANLGLSQWIRQAFPRTVMEVVDDNLFQEEEQINSKCESCIVSMIELALDCTKEKPESRITMKDVVKRLNKMKNTFLG